VRVQVDEAGHDHEWSNVKHSSRGVVRPPGADARDATFGVDLEKTIGLIEPTAVPLWREEARPECKGPVSGELRHRRGCYRAQRCTLALYR
jgi:hypothetical protein